MKIARYTHNDQIACGMVEGDTLRPIRGDIFGDFSTTEDRLPLSDVALLPPVEPGKLVCVGLNYKRHAEESGAAIPEEPMLFMCAPSAVIPDGGTILLDSQDARIDYEAEIAIVIGKQARNLPEADARSCIFGYTICNDVSNRDYQKKDGQFTRAKSFDTYKPLGPWIETGLDPDNAAISLRQNGELRQQSNTSDMIFSIDRIVAFVSGIMTLNPGDVIITGTPEGVGPMRSGDRIEIEIEGIGTLANSVANA
ncbi:fumarylacetoacetate hydrolase family protein [Pseudooceanicola batsensis HTCC2597]|uniref:Fumarylacetoacetate hydrolase family protein n=1 Tax=Pseudooceanicola batsensis (strain ATCC BAA-863 / DSM 15984 / KCTC 12145 / HTCC2597) TaxID=252305 RepID=A3TUH0_PSEBH|nr:fumarylacetoacetate hydrolase family protein [Pseudooceanicola batsensis]EAQ04166.1 fumarylacetoacetate hydrolase family protein [Pseudooceanicola batsensis HTCC2597]